MGEALGGLKRTMMCGEPREANIGSKITLMGWVQRNRKLGGLEFIDLRDRTGIMQIVFGEEINAESFEKAKSVRPEYCIAVTGEVVKRQSPNLQEVRVIDNNGHAVRKCVCTSCLKAGKVQKAV